MCPITSRRRRTGFTLIELLVVIAIIAVLAGMLMPAVMLARRVAREKACFGHISDLHKAIEQYRLGYNTDFWMPLWLTQLGDLGYCGDLRDSDDHVPSDPDYDWKAMRNTFRDSVLICPNDGTSGDDGGRPNSLLSEGSLIYQYPGADIDAHEGGVVVDPDEDDENNRVPCSYLFEFNSEYCSWANPSGPNEGEFEGVNWTARGKPYIEEVDLNHDDIVSWFEIKMKTVTGDSVLGLPTFGQRVPIIRCYWHVEGKYLVDDSKVLAVTGLGNVYVGGPLWFQDKDAH